MHGAVLTAAAQRAPVERVARELRDHLQCSGWGLWHYLFTAVHHTLIAQVPSAQVVGEHVRLDVFVEVRLRSKTPIILARTTYIRVLSPFVHTIDEPV